MEQNRVKNTKLYTFIKKSALRVHLKQLTFCIQLLCRGSWIQTTGTVYMRTLVLQLHGASINWFHKIHKTPNGGLFWRWISGGVVGVNGGFNG